jgi:AcrR family transcriptional regulator
VSPRTAVASQQIRDARRDAILAAARRVFARNGLAATRTSDIAAEARISQGLLYHYFPTKEDLFTEIVEAAMRETVALTTRAAQAPGQAWARLEQLCEQMRAGVLQYPEYPLVILQAYTSEAVPQKARSAIQAYGQQVFAALIALVSQGQADGTVVSGDPVELTVAFTACIQGLALSRLQADHETPTLPSAQTLLRLLRA